MDDNRPQRERRPIEPALDPEGPFRSGYVALVGRPNVGKSTLLNHLLGTKLAATTHKPQTTRKNLLGILHPPGAQLLLLDTPGYHQAKGPLNRYMVDQARRAIDDADVIGYLVEARSDATITPGNERILDALRASTKPVVLLLNKIDRLKDKQGLLLQLQAYAEQLGDRMVTGVPISAYRGDGLKDAVLELARALPEGPVFFEDDQITDVPEQAVAAEFVREKVMLATKDELPYAAAVTIDLFEDNRPRLVRIIATVHVERSSQKPIVIGKQGERVKQIGTAARRDLEFFLDSKVYLELHVRVSGEWSNTPRGLAALGYGEEAKERGGLAVDLAALADLTDVDLSAADGSDVDLSAADGSDVDLSAADGSDVDLSAADGSDVDLSAGTNVSNDRDADAAADSDGGIDAEGDRPDDGGMNRPDLKDAP